jgi:hypothetical protein
LNDPLISLAAFVDRPFSLLFLQMAVHDGIKESASSYHLQHVIDLENMAVLAQQMVGRACHVLDGAFAAALSSEAKHSFSLS